jgi:hypothetical protein
LRAESELARRDSDTRRQLDVYLRVLKLARIESSSEGIYNTHGALARYEPDAYESIWLCAQSLPSASDLQSLIKELRDLDTSREPWSEHVDRQRIIEENAGWERHLRWMLAEWAGRDPGQWAATEENRRIAMLRMLIIKLALRAYELDYNRLPQSLSELVPNNLTAIPNDPFSGASFRFRMESEKDDGYILYSIGPDREDDGGKPILGPDVDLTDEELFPPRTPPVVAAPAPGSPSTP